MQEDISTKVKKKAYELGYDLCGIIEAKSFKEFSDYLNLRVEKFPSSTHLYKNLIGLAQPLEKAPWGKSIIVCIRRYNKYKVPENLDKLFGKVFLFDGRVENSKEYSRNILFTQYLEEQRMKTCQEQVSARWAAVKAGLGYFGENNFVFTKFGSFVWIDTWIVDLKMEYDKKSDDKVYSCPDHCHRCVNSCPTKENKLLYVINPRFWYISKDRIWLWKCNAIRAMVNSKDNKYYNLIKDACNDNNDKIKSMATWACKQLEI